MSTTLTCLALAFVGVDLGYRPAPQGGVEFIVQIAPSTLATLQPGDPIPLTVPREAQQAKASQITLTLGSGPVPRILPASDSAPSAVPHTFQSAPSTAPPFRVGPPGAAAVPYRSAPPDMSSAPARAPEVPALPVMASPVTTAGAAMPLAPPDNPSLAAPNGQGLVRVAPPSGTPIAPATTGEQGQLTGQGAGSSSSSNQAGNRFGALAPVGGSAASTSSIDTFRLVLYLIVIALAASNGYVAWLFLDARQRYIGLVSQTFAAAK